LSAFGLLLFNLHTGAYIASASWKGDSEESWMSGTSMATPHVAGAAALYLQVGQAEHISQLATTYKCRTQNLLGGMHCALALYAANF
jgi:subtilisin family serine protease